MEAFLHLFLLPETSQTRSYLILGQIPTLAQYRGLALLIIGAILSFVGNLQQGKINRQVPKPTTMEKMDMITGFKGV